MNIERSFKNADPEIDVPESAAAIDSLQAFPSGGIPVCADGDMLSAFVEFREEAAIASDDPRNRIKCHGDQGFF